ncbi:MAG: AAA family ATPase, partial [Acidimicrobiales bacterium]
MITHIALENWRAYRRLDLDVEPGTTFLVAANGIGKSSLLEAVRWVLGAGHVDPRPSMMRRGHADARAVVTLTLPQGELVMTRSLRAKGARLATESAATLGGREVSEEEAARLLEASWSADARFVSRSAFLTEDLRRDAEDPNLRAHLCRAYSLDDLQRSVAEIEPVLAKLSRGLKASRAELSATQAQLAEAGEEVVAASAVAVTAKEVVEVARAAHGEARAALDAARAVATEHAAATAWRVNHAALLEHAAPVLGPVEPHAPLAEALSAREAALAAEVDALRQEKATLQVRLDGAIASLATLHDAQASCPVCLRELDDDSRARAELVHRATVETVSDELARLEDAPTPAALDAVRDLARQAAALGPTPEAKAPGDVEGRAEAEAQALAVLEAAAAGLREAELKAEAAARRVETIRAELAAMDALTEQYRA